MGGKAGAVAEVEPLHRLQKTQASQLVEILRIHSSAAIPLHYAPDETVIGDHSLLAGLPVSLLGRPQQFQPRAHFAAGRRRESFFFITTVVPRPGTERTVTASMKLSIMVKPMPLRSAPPVVNMGWRACSMSGMPRP